MTRPTTSVSKGRNPFNVARELYTLLAFMPDVIKWGRTQPRKLEALHKTAVFYCEKPHIVAGLEQKALYHHCLKEELEDSLESGGTYILLPGVVVDNTTVREGVFPGKTGLDIMHEHNRLGNEIGKIVEHLYSHLKVPAEKFNKTMQRIVFMQMTDLILPVNYRIENRKYQIIHKYPNAVKATNNDLQSRGKRGFGKASWKEPGFYRARNDFAETTVGSEQAHRIYEQKYADLIETIMDGEPIAPGPLRRLVDLFKPREFTEEELATLPPKELIQATPEDISRKVTKVIAYNLQIKANAYATYFAMTHPDEVIPFAPKTSYVHKLIKRMKRMVPLRVTEPGKKGVMKNASKSFYGVCDESALRILEGFLAGELSRSLGQRVGKTIYQPTREYIEPVRKREICNVDGISGSIRVSCNGTKDCKPKCAREFLENKFTLDDVVETVEKLKLNEKPKRLFDEMRFTEKELEHMKLDGEKEQYTYPGSIHQDLEELSSGKDALVYLISNQEHYFSRSWMKMHGKPKVSGFPIKSAKTRPYQMRASEFGALCHLSRLVSKMDRDALGVEDENHFSIVGTATHKLWNMRPWIHYRERPNDCSPHCLEFCEKKLAFSRDIDGEEVVVLGSADGIATVEGEDGNFLMILDRKRANYYKQAFTFQTMMYNQAVMQMLTQTSLIGRGLSGWMEDFQGYFTIINKRPFVSVVTEPVMPHMVIGYAPKEGAEDVRLKELDPNTMKVRWAYGLEDIMRKSLRVQQKLVNEKNYAQWYKMRMQTAGGCAFDTRYGRTDCLSKKKCDALMQGLDSGGVFSDWFFPSVTL